MTRKPALLLSVIAATLSALSLAISGCGRSQIAAKTPEKTATRFAEAIAAGDFDTAAKAFDYIATARKQNEDWDSIPSGQRQLIISKLQEQRGDKLPAYSQRIGSNPKIQTLQNNIIKITGDTGSVTVNLTQRDGRWYIAQIW